MRASSPEAMELLATSAAQSTMGMLLGKLGGLIAERYTLLGGVRDEIQELKDELESMGACFRDVAGIGDDDGQKEQVRDKLTILKSIPDDSLPLFGLFVLLHSFGFP